MLNISSLQRLLSASTGPSMSARAMSKKPREKSTFLVPVSSNRDLRSAKPEAVAESDAVAKTADSLTLSDAHRHSPTLTDTLTNIYRPSPTLTNAHRRLQTLTDVHRRSPTLTDAHQHSLTLPMHAGRGGEKGSLCVVQSSELTSELASEPRKSRYPSCILRAYFRACFRASEEWLSLIYPPSLLPIVRPSLGKVRPSLGRVVIPHISSEARIRGSERLGNPIRGSETASEARIRGMKLGSEV
jgi:hypothetical protein